MVILSIFFFITAILYSSVGFGGGSTYLALMLIWDIPYYIFPIIADGEAGFGGPLNEIGRAHV